MEKRTRNLRLVGRDEVSLGELIHQAVLKTIEEAVEEELRATLGAAPYERRAERSGYRNGTKTRTLTGPTGPVELTLPRGRLATSDTGTEEWRSTVVPRYQRRMREVNEAVAGVYLSGGNTRRIRGALRPLLKNAPLSKSAVSRIVGTLRGEWEAPRLCIIDGNAGLNRAITLAWRGTKIQRCAVHKLRNILRKVPQHAHEEITDDYHLIVYASGLDAATTARDAFVKKWSKRCPGAVESLNEAGDELMTFYSFPKQQWKTIRTTNVIERINEEFRRRVKTQGSFPSENCALVLLYSLVASGQINLRRIDGYEKIVDVIAREEDAAA